MATEAPGASFSAIVIKLLATSGTCNAAVIAESELAPGLLAWGTSLHAQPTTPPSYADTETPFSIAPLSAAELAHLTSTCTLFGPMAAVSGSAVVAPPAVWEP
jgi:hypothetical protein